MQNEMKWMTQLKKGLIELCCLNLLTSEQLYGYELARRLSVAPGFDVSLGTVYPLLSRMRREGLVESELEESPQGPARRKYRLSQSGTTKLQAMNAHWENMYQYIESIRR